ncbi:DUF1307 domain-containing protein [Staphylococcus haemolyticus]|nr:MULTISPECIES: DUF1307 domain-containing protein [unclassified Staphylococcus]MBF2757528.1 DUF1307 domain-containing protein [Staphylococcus haemolyticus]MBF2774008.1 DUF1307 domain-containing protein [Staphylococcus haemolyticus]MBF2776587.1 DUF1307 domain-containing protein [Staphylococcus haemolyticus]MBF2815829.1 DUF1307 domain-containing protein [Staphylococcus haemolyticus]MBF9719451.1 DUF1307 domain-containing protein [Staphylococcus haemolyticus]
MMKKCFMLMILLVLSVSVLGACSKERSKTYEGDMDGKHVLTTLSYKKNKVVKQSTVTTLKYNDFGMSKKEAKKMFQDHRQMKDLKGVSYNLKHNHEKWVETIDINYKKADIKAVKNHFSLMSTSKNDKKVNMEGTVRELKKLGFKQKSNMTDE